MEFLLKAGAKWADSPKAIAQASDMVFTALPGPREVEEVIYQHPSVVEVSVIGVPHDYWGEAVKAIIVLKEGAIVAEEEMIKFCGEHLASYKKPKSVEFWKELPKSPQGKILKKSIREHILNLN